jgi:hypothetical protein
MAEARECGRPKASPFVVGAGPGCSVSLLEQQRVGVQVPVGDAVNLRSQGPMLVFTEQWTMMRLQAESLASGSAKVAWYSMLSVIADHSSKLMASTEVPQSGKILELSPIANLDRANHFGCWAGDEPFEGVGCRKPPQPGRCSSPNFANPLSRSGRHGSLSS